MNHASRTVKRTRVVRTERFVVVLDVDAVVLDEEPEEISFPPTSVELLREVERRAKNGDLDWLKRHGKVYAAVNVA